MFTVESARKLLTAADVFIGTDDDRDRDDFSEEWLQTLNMNDVWEWACADAEHVPDEELPRVAELFWRYGSCGLLYWVSERRQQLKSEFYDINRFIEFVRREEEIRRSEPSQSRRAYLKQQYTIGEDSMEAIKE
jgi:hypothetical protein